MAKLRDQVNKLKEEKEKLLRQEKDEVEMLVDVQPPAQQGPGPQEDDLPLLIDLSDPGNDQGKPLPSSAAPPTSQTILTTNLMETDDSAHLEEDILQPEVVQSQELF